jgi:membrane-bound metal-dependent hydrolase YbcI (DUF457 family)
MDTFSHAAWGLASLRTLRDATTAGQSERRIRWWAAMLAGAMPDLLWAIPLTIQRTLGLGTPPPAIPPGHDIWRAHGAPLPAYLVEAYYRYYVKSHSLLLVAVVCAGIWLSGRRRWLWLAVPYALHILVDIPTHERYETRPLWPLSSWHMQGLAWSDPRVFIPNLVALAGVYLWLWRTRRL